MIRNAKEMVPRAHLVTNVAKFYCASCTHYRYPATSMLHHLSIVAANAELAYEFSVTTHTQTTLPIKAPDYPQTQSKILLFRVPKSVAH